MYIIHKKVNNTIYGMLFETSKISYNRIRYHYNLKKTR